MFFPHSEEKNSHLLLLSPCSFHWVYIQYKLFMFWTSYQLHMNVRLGSEYSSRTVLPSVIIMWRIDPDTECRGCGRILSSSKTRAEHESRRHPYLHWFQCPLCVAPSSFHTPSSTDLVIHITKLHVPVQCTKCGERLETAVDLQRHAALTLQLAPMQPSLLRSNGVRAAEMLTTPQGRVRTLKRELVFNLQRLRIENKKTSTGISSLQVPISPKTVSSRFIQKRKHDQTLPGYKSDAPILVLEAKDKTPTKSITAYNKEIWNDPSRPQMDVTPLRADESSLDQSKAAVLCIDDISNASENEAMMTAHTKWDTTYFETQSSAPSENKVSSVGSVTGILRRVGSGGSDPVKRVRFAKCTATNLDTTPLRGESPNEASSVREDDMLNSPKIYEKEDAMMTANSNWDITTSLLSLPLPDLNITPEITNNESELMTTASTSFHQ